MALLSRLFLYTFRMFSGFQFCISLFFCICTACWPALAGATVPRKDGLKTVAKHSGKSIFSAGLFVYDTSVHWPVKEHTCTQNAFSLLAASASRMPRTLRAAEAGGEQEMCPSEWVFSCHCNPDPVCLQPRSIPSKLTTFNLEQLCPYLFACDQTPTNPNHNAFNTSGECVDRVGSLSQSVSQWPRGASNSFLRCIRSELFQSNNAT